MKTTINKCDRCKKSVNVLIDIQIVNQNVEEEEKSSNEKNMFSFSGRLRQSYPTISKEVCVECAMELCKWLDHSENLLLKSRVV